MRQGTERALKDGWNLAKSSAPDDPTVHALQHPPLSRARHAVTQGEHGNTGSRESGCTPTGLD
eukprot:4538769-Alexandrium_andersonii.AAC.1